MIYTFMLYVSNEMKWELAIFSISKKTPLSYVHGLLTFKKNLRSVSQGRIHTAMVQSLCTCVIGSRLWIISDFLLAL